MPRGRNQMSYYGQCPENEMPHMQRPPGPCFDNYSKMDGPCGMGVSEFKSPMMNADHQPPPAKKKRRTSNAMAAAAQPAPTPAMQDLCPPPLTGYGDTIVASNPFDDTPSVPSMSHINPMNHVNKHMGVGPCMSPAGPPMMGSISPCHIVGSPMGCGPSVGSPINCGPPMGSCSPMGGSANNANCGPVGSPHTSCSGRQVSRSPLVCTPISTSSVMSNSPMNVNSVLPMNRSPSSLGSPLGSVMASNVRGNSPLDCGLGINSVGSQKGSPMSVMSSHNMNNLNCGSPMGSPSNVPLNNCNSNNMMGSPIASPLSNVPCSLSSGSDLGLNLNGVMNRSPLNAPPPNSISSSMMCNSSMRGPSPISGGAMNGPMSMSCNPNPTMVNMNSKADMNMNDLALRESCGPGHIPMKPNNGPSGCGMPVSNASCTRQSDMTGMQCGPMNSPHCNPMMSNQCGPSMNHGPCIGGGINRPPCPPNMGMGIPFDGMNPQFRPSMNRSQFPRGMANVHYGPNSMNNPMNGPMNGTVNSPMNNHMNGPNMNSMCGPPELNNLPGCSPNNNNASNMHCVDQPSMNNVQCMSNSMNQCGPPPPNSMFNPQYSPFDVNNSRCSPNLHFNPNDMNINGNFYRSSNVNNGSGTCMPNMHPVVCTNSNDVLNVADSVMSSGASSKNDNSTVDSDIASVVCGITSDNTDDLNLLGDELLRDNKPDERKSIKDFGSNRMLMNDDPSEIKDEEVEGKPNKTDLDAKIIEDSKRDQIIDKTDSMSLPNPVTTTATTTTSSVLTTSTCTSTVSTSASSVTTGGTVPGIDISTAVSENGDNGSCGSANNAKGTEANDDDDEFVFKTTNNETQSNTSVPGNNNTTIENETTALDDTIPEDKIKNEPEDKLLENDFRDDDDKILCEDKNDANGGDSSSNVSTVAEENNGVGSMAVDKENGKTSSIVKMEGEEFFDNNTMRKNECITPGNGMRPSGNGFPGPNMIAGPGPGFNTPTSNDVMSGMMSNVPPCMNDTLCGSSMLPNMNRTGLPNTGNHALNFPNRNVCKVYPINKSKVFNPQNPNAPPIYACGKCHKEINDNDQAILCESGCHSWYHRTCSGLTETAYQLLTTEIYAEWACDVCLLSKNIPLVKYKP